MHIKIYLVGSFMGVKVTETTTIRELVEIILTKYQAPIEYAKMCTIAAKKGNEYALTLQHNELVINYESYMLFFRIINFFTKEQDIELVHPMYLQLTQLQMHKLIIDNLWLIDQILQQLINVEQNLDLIAINKLGSQIIRQRALFLHNLLIRKNIYNKIQLINGKNIQNGDLQKTNKKQYQIIYKQLLSGYHNLGRMSSIVTYLIRTIKLQELIVSFVYPVINV
ncbi:Conserved_hypothetical protein [Hexamita inflata]|uniref:Uncharacterized protein n=1 Tax=Hexamita inflata TaxID=28002 RepID=A0AA86NWY8_9EUKA|nr:Conserved hypothetical protein [Hexamita inflata]